MASWIITDDLINNGEAVGEWNGNKEYIDAGKCKYTFRMLDDDNEVYYIGKSGNSSAFDPLDQFGMPNAGCTDIQYLENGKWKSL